MAESEDGVRDGAGVDRALLRGGRRAPRLRHRSPEGDPRPSRDRPGPPADPDGHTRGDRRTRPRDHDGSRDVLGRRRARQRARRPDDAAARRHGCAPHAGGHRARLRVAGGRRHACLRSRRPRGDARLGGAPPRRPERRTRRPGPVHVPAGRGRTRRSEGDAQRGSARRARHGRPRLRHPHLSHRGLGRRRDERRCTVGLGRLFLPDH